MGELKTGGLILLHLFFSSQICCPCSLSAFFWSHPNYHFYYCTATLHYLYVSMLLAIVPSLKGGHGSCSVRNNFSVCCALEGIIVFIKVRQALRSLHKCQGSQGPYRCLLCQVRPYKSLYLHHGPHKSS